MVSFKKVSPVGLHSLEVLIYVFKILQVLPEDASYLSLKTEILDGFHDFKEALTNPESDQSQASYTFGNLPRPLGPYRLKVVEFLTSTAERSSPAVFSAFIKNDLFKIILDLNFDYKWNNLLHGFVERALNAALVPNNEEVIDHLLTHCLLHERFAQVGLASDTQNNSMRSGAMGFVLQQATRLIDLSRNSEKISHILEASDSWKNFLDTEYKDSITKQNTPTGQSDDREEDHPNHEEFGEV